MEVVASVAAIKAAFFDDIQCRQELFVRLCATKNNVLTEDAKVI